MMVLSQLNNFLRPVPCSFLFAFKLVTPDDRNPKSDSVEIEQVALDPIEFSRSRPIEHQSRSDCCQMSRRRAARVAARDCLLRGTEGGEGATRTRVLFPPVSTRRACAPRRIQCLA